MDKEEGFTLVELLAVIVILGIIMAIAVPGIGKVISNSQEKADEAEIELIKDAGRIYFTTDKAGIEKAKTGGSVEVVYLINNNYLSLDDEKAKAYTESGGKKAGEKVEITADGKITYEPTAKEK